MAKETVLSNINLLTFKTQKGFQNHVGEIGEFDLVFTPDTSADRDLMNTTDNVDIVIESQLPTADNGYTWYRKYKSGWVEQGGYAKHGTVTLPIEMIDAHYTVVSTAVATDGYLTYTKDKTTTSFYVILQLHSGTIGSNIYCDWQVSGMAQHN